MPTIHQDRLGHGQLQVFMEPASLPELTSSTTKGFGDDIILPHQAREEAINRMQNEAIELGADAVVEMRFMTSMIMQGAAEMLAYGTAVKIN